MKKLCLLSILLVLIIFTSPSMVKSQPLTWIHNTNNNHFYALTEVLTWHDAEEQAQSLGLHLVTINDQAENDWILSTFGCAPNGFWIGFNDLEEEGNWVWSSGESSGYTNWYLGEPSNGGDQENEHVACFNLIDWWAEPEPTPIACGFWNDEPEGPAHQGIIEADMLDFFDASAQLGTLEGRGRGCLAKLRLFLMREMLVITRELIEHDKINAACFTLQRAYKRCDDNPLPLSDFVVGEALEELAGMIGSLQTSLGCN